MRKIIPTCFFLIAAFCSCSNHTNQAQFTAVIESLKNSNELIRDKCQIIYASLDEKLKDPQTVKKAEIWQPKAMVIMKARDTLMDYVNDLKATLNRNGGHSSVAKDLFETNGKAKELEGKLNNYYATVFGVVVPEEFEDNQYLKKDIAQLLINFKKKLRSYGSLNSSQDSLDTLIVPASEYFLNSSIIGAQMMLSKIENDVLSSEYFMIDYFNNLTIALYHGYTEYIALITQSSNFIKSGQILEIIAGVGAFSLAAKPEITIDGKLQKINTDGVATYLIRGKDKPGKYLVPVTVEYYKPDGTRYKISRIIEYGVEE